MPNDSDEPKRTDPAGPLEHRFHGGHLCKDTTGDGCCDVCGVSLGETCDECGGRGYHRDGCGRIVEWE